MNEKKDSGEETLKEEAKQNSNEQTAGEADFEALTSEKEENKSDKESVIAEMNDKYLRLYSEFDNFRKRTVRERLDLIQTAGSDIIKELLPILDDFERALKSNEKLGEAAAQIQQGFVLIHNKLLHNLQKKGLEEMKSLGEPFDPELQEAVTKIQVPAEKSGLVVDVLEKGYYLNGKVLRYAKVVVGE